MLLMLGVVGFAEGCGWIKLQQETASTRSTVVSRQNVNSGQFNHRQVSLFCPDAPVFVCVGVFMCLNVYARATHTDEEERTVLSSSPVLTVLLIPSTCSNTHPKKHIPPPLPCACAGSPWGQAAPLPSSPHQLSSLARLRSPQPLPALHTLIVAKTNSFQMFGKDPLFASGPNKIIFTSYPVVIRAERIEFMWHW